MSEGRTIVEVTGRRRIVREYAADGRLVHIRVEPVTYGATPDLPPVDATPPRIVKRAKPEPPAPAPAPAPAEAPPPEPELPVTLEPYEEPAPELPVTVEPYEEPVPAAAPPPPPAPKRFEVLSAEPLVPEPAPPAPEPEPVVEAPPPPPEPEPSPPPSPAPPPAPAEAEPEPQRPFAEVVPDVDARVDALLGDREKRARSRKRAPLPVPSFEPLRREPWEDRLDAALADR